MRASFSLCKYATSARNYRKSPAIAGDIPVFGRLWLETFFDLHCVADIAVFSGLPPAGLVKLGLRGSSICRVYAFGAKAGRDPLRRGYVRCAQAH